MLHNSRDHLIQAGPVGNRSRFFVADCQLLAFKVKPSAKHFIYVLVKQILQNINNQHYEKSH